MIYITGDLHGDINSVRGSNIMNTLKTLTEDDFLIVTGDFGYIWNNAYTPKETGILNNLRHTVNNATILFVDGNHENFERLYNLPTVEMFGNEVGIANDGIYWLKRGNIYNIENNKIFTFGGAASIDKMWRKNRISWWEEEIPNSEEVNRAYETINTAEQIDYIITHTCPDRIKNKFPNWKLDGGFECPVQKMLDYIDEVSMKRFPNLKWYFGHFHWNQNIDDRYNLLYEKVLKLGENVVDAD